MTNPLRGITAVPGIVVRARRQEREWLHQAAEIERYRNSPRHLARSPSPPQTWRFGRRATERRRP